MSEENTQPQAENTQEAQPEQPKPEATQAQPAPEAENQNRTERRFAKFTADLKRYEEQNNNLAQENQQLKKMLEGIQQGQQSNQQAQGPQGMPNINNYTDLDTYYADVAKYNAELMQQSLQQNQQDVVSKMEEMFNKRERENAARQQQQKFQQTEAEYAKNNPDYYSMVNDTLGYYEGMDQELKQFIVDSGPKVLHKLAKNPMKIFDLKGKNKIQAMEDIFRLKSESPAPSSTAPNPVPPTPSTGNSTINLAEMSPEAYEAHMNKIQFGG